MSYSFKKSEEKMESKRYSRNPGECSGSNVIRLRWSLNICPPAKQVTLSRNKLRSTKNLFQAVGRNEHRSTDISGDAVK